MKITTILFDLDGTLLPMDQNIFTETYFGLLAKKMMPYGYEPKELVSAVWNGTSCMIKNDGSVTNEQAFWKRFVEIYGDKVKEHYHLFEDFYENDFDNVKDSCGENPKAKELVLKLKERGFRIALATNPIFPAVATQKRIGWVGLKPEDFEFYTTYENENYCKPNIKYYEDILNRLGVSPDECLMIGNDATEDMVASELGINVFLLTDCIINENNVDISKYPNGNFDDLEKYIENL